MIRQMVSPNLFYLGSKDYSGGSAIYMNSPNTSFTFTGSDVSNMIGGVTI